MGVPLSPHLIPGPREPLDLRQQEKVVLPKLGLQARGWGQGEGLSPESRRGGVRGMEGRAQELSALCRHPWGTGLSCCEPGRDRCSLREDRQVLLLLSSEISPSPSPALRACNSTVSAVKLLPRHGSTWTMTVARLSLPRQAVRLRGQLTAAASE